MSQQLSPGLAGGQMWLSTLKTLRGMTHWICESSENVLYRVGDADDS
jgi:hypothetical protein